MAQMLLKMDNLTVFNVSHCFCPLWTHCINVFANVVILILDLKSLESLSCQNNKKKNRLIPFVFVFIFSFFVFMCSWRWPYDWWTGTHEAHGWWATWTIWELMLFLLSSTSNRSSIVIIEKSNRLPYRTWRRTGLFKSSTTMAAPTRSYSSLGRWYGEDLADGWWP